LKYDIIVILGLVILIAALVAGVLANGGHAHAVTHFAVFGYQAAAVPAGASAPAQ
jgi:flagellar motor component MotA